MTPIEELEFKDWIWGAIHAGRISRDKLAELGDISHNDMELILDPGHNFQQEIYEYLMPIIKNPDNAIVVNDAVGVYRDTKSR